MPEGERVELFVNPTNDTAVVPDVAGMTLEDARRALEAAGFRVVEPVTEESDEVADGRVIRTDPAEGDEAGVQDPITVFVAGDGCATNLRSGCRGAVRHRGERSERPPSDHRRRSRGRGRVHRPAGRRPVRRRGDGPEPAGAGPARGRRDRHDQRRASRRPARPRRRRDPPSRSRPSRSPPSHSRPSRNRPNRQPPTTTRRRPRHRRRRPRAAP